MAGLAAKRSGFAFCLWGDPGIGKSHAAARLMLNTPIRHFSLHATAPISALLRALPRPAKLPAWVAPILEKLERTEFVPAQGFADALGALLVGLAPVIVCFEDLHETSPERLEGITALAQVVMRARGVGLIVTSRAEPPPPFLASRLEPLDLEASRALLEAEAGASLPAEAIAWMFERSRGNPLFTLEHFRYLARRGNIWNDARRWYWRSPPPDFVPASVEALIERALREAASDARLEEALGSKAILPLGADDALWAQVAMIEAEDLARVRADLEWRGILAQGEFAHPLYREVMAHNLRRERLQVYARRAIAALEHDPEAAAQFLEQAGLESDEARTRFVEAARAARAAGDELRSAHFLAGAVDHASGETRHTLALEAALVLRHHDLAQAMRLAEIAFESPDRAVEVVWLLGELSARLDRAPDIERLRQRLPVALREAINWHELDLEMHYRAEDHATVVALWERTPELYRSERPDLRTHVASSMLAVGRNDQARMLVADRLRMDALDIAERCDLLRMGALMHISQGNYREADRLSQELLGIARGVVSPRILSSILLNRAAALRYLGEYQTMLACLEESLELRRSVGEPKSLAFAQAALTEMLIERGEFERAEETLLEALETLRVYPPSRFLVNTEVMASLLYGAMAAPLSAILAVRHAESALQLARNLNSPRLVAEILPDAAIAQTRNGDPQGGRALALEAISLLPSAGDDPAYRWRALLALGLAEDGLQRHDLARSHLREALAVAEIGGSELDRRKIGLEIDRLTGDLESARAHLVWFEAHGLRNGANIARQYFPGLTDDASRAPSGTQASGSSRLEILGPMQLVTNAQAEPVRGHKRQELLARLLEARMAGRDEVSRLELLDGLYPEADESQATASLKALIHQMRSNLGQGTIRTTPNGYALGAISSDAEEFLERGEARLWRGAYLEGLDHQGGETVREALHLRLRSSLERLLEADPKGVSRLARILCEAEPYDLKILRLCLMALRTSGNHRSLTRFYDESRARLEEVGERLPERWKDFLEKA